MKSVRIGDIIQFNDEPKSEAVIVTNISEIGGRHGRHIEGFTINVNDFHKYSFTESDLEDARPFKQ